jgi:crossover junction endodeoxyribonuclease RuvC
MDAKKKQVRNACVVGLDIATKVGYAVVTSDGSGVRKLDSGVLASRLGGFPRLSDLAGRMMSLMDTHNPDLVVIEGYGFANKNTLVTLVEVGTVLRYFLWQADIEYTEVAPTSLKKFVSGKGNVKKEMILKEVFKRWGYDVNSNDEADAIGLAYMGLGILGLYSDLPKVNMSALKPYLG